MLKCVKIIKKSFSIKKKKKLKSSLKFFLQKVSHDPIRAQLSRYTYLILQNMNTVRYKTFPHYTIHLVYVLQ